MDYGSIMAAFSSLALGHSLFLAVYFWKRGDTDNLPNRLLALLLLALAIRITKSVIVVLFPAAPDVIPAIGLIGMAAIGPLLFLYVRSLLEADFGLNRLDALHFLLPAFLLVAIPFFSEPVIFHCYQVTVAQLLAYLSVSGYRAFQERLTLRHDSDSWQWLLLLHLGVGAIWLTFFVQLTLETFSSYVAVTVTATLVLYGLSLWAMRRQQVFSSVPESGRAEVETPDLASKALGEHLRGLFEEQKIYTDADLTLTKLANTLEVPAYLVSRAVNSTFQKTFPELLYTFRVAEAERRLRSPKHQHLSVEAIAYDSGFNSLSAFYAAFKKLNGISPARYRKQVG